MSDEPPLPNTVRPTISGSVGQAVQAGTVHGDVHFHGPEAPPFPSPRQLPGGVRDFVNRSDEIAQLDARLDADGSGTLLIAGTAGAGKTALALHWGHRVKTNYPDGQLYANLRGYDPRERVAVERTVDGFLHALGVSPASVPSETDERIALYRSILAGGRFLVVLDNAASAQQVRPLVPGGSGCAVVVTTRDRLSGLVARDGAHRIRLGTLSAPQSVALLRMITNATRGKDASTDLAHLARLCALLPLALRIAAERAAVRPHMPLSELIHELQDESGRWEALTVDDEQDTVRSVFAWSYRGLPGDAARLFRVLGLLPTADFSVSVAAAAVDLPIPSTSRLLDVLTGAHLIDQTAADRFEFHDLLRAYAAELGRRHDSQEARHSVLRRVLLWYLRTAHEAASFIDSQFRVPTWTSLEGSSPSVFADRSEAVEWFEKEQANLVSAVKVAEAESMPELGWQLALTLGRVYASRPRIDDWIATGQIGLRAARAHAPASAIADLLENLGMALVQGERSDDALTHHQEALAIRTAEGDPFSQGESHNSLGLVLLRAHRMDDAQAHFERALACFRELGDEQWKGITLANLSDALLGTGDLDGAEQAAEAALHLQRRSGNRVGEFSTLITLSRAAQERGRSSEALALTTRALRVAEELENGLRIAYASMELGRLRAAGGDVEAALEAFLLSAAIHRRLGEAVREAEALQGAAEVQRGAGSADESMALYRSAVSTYRRSGTRRHLAFALAGFGRLLAGTGHPAEALDALSEARVLLAAITDPDARSEQEVVERAVHDLHGQE